MRLHTCPLPTEDLPGFLAWHRDRFGDATMTAPGEPPVPPAPPAPSPPQPAPDATKFTDPDTGDSYDFPPATPLSEMKPEQVAEYWRHKARKHEGVAKSRGDYDELKQRAAEADRLRQERETEAEKQVREAREDAARQEREKNAPRLVSAEFRAAAKGVLTSDQTAALLEDLDLTKYLTATGEVDVEKVEKKVTALAPKKDESQQRFPDLGQGKRAGDAKPSVATGREMYEARRGNKAS